MKERYVDESGFCLIPYIPYAWQERKQKIEVPSQQSKRLNVLGFLSRQNDLEVYTNDNAVLIVTSLSPVSTNFVKKSRKRPF